MSDSPKFIDTDLLARIEAYMAANGMTPTEFGLKATNDRRLLPDLKEGRELRRATREKILALIDGAPKETTPPPSTLALPASNPSSNAYSDASTTSTEKAGKGTANKTAEAAE
jgi:hypothetical protein